MTQPFQIPGLGAGEGPAPPRTGLRRRALAASLASLAVVAGTAALGLLAGAVWGAVAPRPELVMTSPGVADLVHVETSSYIAADGAFVVIAVVGGLVSGVLGFLLAVRRHGPAGMAAVLLGAVAAAYLARWVGEQSGLATFQHLLATLPAGARLRENLTLGAAGALAFWPLAAGASAGGLVAMTMREPAAPPDAGA